MYLSYDNLWKKLSDYGLKKTELMELTGMSSRTLAKLSKNETVNMETILKICEVLHCNVEDVMTISERYTPFSLYDAYCHVASLESETEDVTISKVRYNDRDYLIYVTKSIANNLTVIGCGQTQIQWEQLPFNWKLSGMFAGQTTLRGQPLIPERRKGMTTVVVISGKPSYFTGLDEGIFRSARHPGGEEFVHVMSMSAFKTFVPLENEK